MLHLVEFGIIALIIWNIVTFLLYFIDKRLSKKHKRRIKEITLLICAFIMGGVGAILGMWIFHHKTKHLKFLIFVPLAVILNVLVIFYLLKTA